MAKPRHRETTTILLCEDDRFAREHLSEILSDRGYHVLGAGSEQEALQVLQTHGTSIGVALVDVRLPSTNEYDDSDSERGKRAGIRIARFIREHFPVIRVIGASFYSDEDTRHWFSEYCFAYIHKSYLLERWSYDGGLGLVDEAAKKKPTRRKPSSFIVHGHDTGTMQALKDFLQNSMGWRRPQVLHEMPSRGRTIIEKFEEVVRDIDVVFVLLTPDDKGSVASDSDDLKRRARQNVIFELGYFYGKMQRKSGRVILLYKGSLELPSDIEGIVYIDISNGIESAGEVIRRELAEIKSKIV